MEKRNCFVLIVDFNCRHATHNSCGSIFSSRYRYA